MKQILTMLLLCVFCSVSGQTSAILQKKVGKVYTHFKTDKIRATDSVLRLLPYDQWFVSLAPKDRNFRIIRIKYYEGICKKKPKQCKYLKGWVMRALN